MTVEQQVLALLVLGGWGALWWLAVRIVTGRTFGLFTWVPVAFLAFVVPLFVSDMAAVSASRFTDEQFLMVWGGTAIVIDAVGGMRHIARWCVARRRGR